MSEMRPGRWWKVVEPDGTVWCETSDENEARAAQTQPYHTLMRLWEPIAPPSEWRVEPR